MEASRHGAEVTTALKYRMPLDGGDVHSQEQIKDRIEGLLSERFGAQKFVEFCGVAAVPALVAALGDWRAKSSSRHPDPEPLRMICELIRPYAPQEAAAHLIRESHRTTGRSLVSVMCTLISIGTSECISAAATCFTHLDPAKREDAENHIWDTLKRTNERIRPDQTTPLFGAVVPRLNDAKDWRFQHVAEILLYLDPARATHLLTGLVDFAIESPELLSIIHAFNHCRVKIPAPLLLNNIAMMKTQSEKANDITGVGRLFEFALPALARTDPIYARPLVEECLKSNHPRTRCGAYTALEILEDVEDAYAVVCRRLLGDDEGYHFDDLTREQQNYWISFKVDEQVCINGFSGFYSNGTKHWIAAPAALVAIGAPKAAALMRRAIIEYGIATADADSFTEIAEKQSHEVEGVDLDSLYFENDEEGVLDLLKVYAAQNPA